MKHRRYLVYSDHVWLPPSIPPNHGRLHNGPQWFLGGLPDNHTGIFPLSAFPDRYWLIVRGREVTAPVISPPKHMGPSVMSAAPCHAIVSTDEFATLIDLGYVRFPCNPLGDLREDEDGAEYFWFDGAPVRVADQRALRIAEGHLIPVLLDRVRAIGDRISRIEFEVCWHHSQRQAKEQES
jgi:hypothetical protein